MRGGDGPLGILLRQPPISGRILILGREIGMRGEEIVGAGIKSIDNTHVGLHLVRPRKVCQIALGLGQITQHEAKILVNRYPRIVGGCIRRRLLCYDRHSQIRQVVFRLGKAEPAIRGLPVFHNLRNLHVIQGSVSIGNAQIRPLRRIGRRRVYHPDDVVHRLNIPIIDIRRINPAVGTRRTDTSIMPSGQCIISIGARAYHRCRGMLQPSSLEYPTIVVYMELTIPSNADSELEICSSVTYCVGVTSSMQLERASMAAVAATHIFVYPFIIFFN